MSTNLEIFAAEEAKAMNRKDLEIRVEVTYTWNNETQQHTDDCQYQVFAYRSQGIAPPADTLDGAITNARKIIKEMVAEHKPECPTPAGPARNCYVCRTTDQKALERE